MFLCVCLCILKGSTPFMEGNEGEKWTLVLFAGYILVFCQTILSSVVDLVLDVGCNLVSS